MLAQHRRRWPSFTSALGQCIVLSGVSGAGISKVSVEDCGPTLKQHWLSAMCLRKVYNRPGDKLVLRQRRRRLTGIEPAVGCSADPTLNRNLVGRPTSSVSGTS